ncbi:unnamed protein product [Alopecurus aequalis]
MDSSSDPPKVGLTQVPPADPGLDVAAADNAAVLPPDTLLDAAVVHNVTVLPSDITLDNATASNVVATCGLDGIEGNTIVSAIPVLNSRENLEELIGGADQNIFEVCTYGKLSIQGLVISLMMILYSFLKLSLRTWILMSLLLS